MTRTPEPRPWLSELDHAALRDLADLRPKAEARFSRGEIQEAIGRHLKSLPPTEVMRQRYYAPYSLAREAAALHKLLNLEPPQRTQVEYVDWNP